MISAYNHSNVIDEKETKYQPDKFIMVSRCLKKMSCLKCGKEFYSEGLYNRICEECNLINESTRVTTYSLSLKFAEITDCLLEEHRFEFY